MKIFNFAVWLIAVLIILTLSLQLSCAYTEIMVSQGNHAPVIEKITYDKFTYHNRPVKIECIATDGDSDNLTYLWEAKVGKITGGGKSIVWAPPGNMQNYPVTLTVTDGRGGEAKQTIYILLVTSADGTNTPNIGVELILGDNRTVVIDNQRVGIWTTAGIYCAIENAEGNDLNYKWSADCGKIQENRDQASTASWIAPGVQSKCTVFVTVTDPHTGSEAKGQVIFNVYCCGKELTQD